MDRLDKISALFLLGLVSVFVFLAFDFPGEAEVKKDNVVNRVTPGMTFAEFEPRIKTLKNLIDAGNIEKAEAIIDELQAGYPYEGDIYMIKGDIMIRKQDPVNAIRAFREAVDLNPDYLDKKTPDFQGYKIKVAIKEAREEIVKRLAKNPADKDTKKARKTMYYLLRRIAGSCG